ncbi:MAG: hypothetical protein IGS03_01490 [Candidatus Sericytochromatia bacterium]|nr:hypothetical protein [Candidatus Sericytochromatia bacterium]
MPSIQNRDPRFQIKTPPPARSAGSSVAPPAPPPAAPAPISAEAEALLQQARQRSQVKISRPTPEAPPPPAPEPSAESEPGLRSVKRLGSSGLASSLSLTGRFVRLDVQALKQRLSESLQQTPGSGYLQRVLAQAEPLISQMRSGSPATPPPAAVADPPPPAVPEAQPTTPPTASSPPAAPALVVPPAAVPADLAQVQQALQGISNLKPDQAPPTFNSLEAAMEYANSKKTGAELIVAVKGPDGQAQYAVIPLKYGQKPEAVKAALAETAPAKAYLTDTNGWLQPLKPAEENNSSRFARVQELSQTALNDNARGLDRNRAGTWDRNRGQAYQQNMLSVHAEVLETQQVLQDEKAGLEHQLQELKAQGQGESLAAVALRSRLNTLGQQLQELGTARSILESRLSQQSKSTREIPGADMTIGQDRNHPERIQERLQQQLNILESRMLVATKEELPALETQREQLVNEMRDVSKRHMEAQAAELSYRMRMGSLATMGQGLDKAQKKLEQKIQKLDQLEIRMAGLKGDELKAVQCEVNSLRLEIDKERKELIKVLKAETKVFEAHANMKERGAKAAVDLLNLQVKKLEALGDLDPRRTLEAVKETQSQLIATVEEAGDKFAGIRPTEAKALVSVSQQTDAYIKDYQKAQTQLKGLQEDIHRKTNLLQNPPVSAVGPQQLTAMQKAYFAKVQDKLKAAPEGSDLEKLKNLYIALEMSNDPKVDETLRQRIDVNKVQAEIQALSQKPEVQKVFEDARAEALQEVFGKHNAADELANHILSPAFQEHLSLLPQEEQAAILKAELGKLQFINPAKAAEVQEQLLAQELISKSGTLLKNAPLQDSKSGFEQAFALINTPLNAADKTAKVLDASAKASIADDLAKAMQQMTPEDQQKLERLLKDSIHNPKSEAAIAKMLEGKLPKHSPAIEKLQGLSKSNKLGAFITLAATIATTGKIPDAFQKGDIKSMADFASSAFSVAGGANGIVKMFGVNLLKNPGAANVSKIAEGTQAVTAFSDLTKAGKALRAMEFLGPVGDVLTVGLDGYGSYKDFSDGDYVGGGAKLVSAGAAGTSAVVGVMILAGASGPGAPFVLAGATIVGLVAWGVDAAFGESDEETFLRQLGVLEPPPPGLGLTKDEMNQRRYEYDMRGFGPKI